jgi:hypothetical protein
MSLHCYPLRCQQVADEVTVQADSSFWRVANTHPEHLYHQYRIALNFLNTKRRISDESDNLNLFPSLVVSCFELSI